MKDMKIKIGDIISRASQVVFITVPPNGIAPEVLSKIRSANTKKIEQLIIRQMRLRDLQHLQEEFEVPDEIKDLPDLKMLYITGNVSQLPLWIETIHSFRCL